MICQSSLAIAWRKAANASSSFDAEGYKINDALIEPKENRDARWMSHRRDANEKSRCRASASLAGPKNVGKQECLPYNSTIRIRFDTANQTNVKVSLHAPDFP